MDHKEPSEGEASLPAPEPSESSAKGANGPRSSTPPHGGDPANIRRLAQLLAVIWTVVSAALLIGTAMNPERLEFDGRRDGLVPAEHRPAFDEMWLVLRLEGDAGRGAQGARSGQPAPSSSLFAAGLAVAQSLADERVSLAPPANAIAGWLDTHGLYLLPIELHRELADRLKSQNIAARIQSLRAQLSSPLFGVSGIEARRDPLGLRELLHSVQGRLGHIDAPDRGSEKPTPTGSGDLVSADGRTLVVQLHSERDHSSLLTDARAAVEGLPVTVELLGPSPDAGRSKDALRARTPQMVLATSAGLLLVVLLAYRRVRPAVCLMWFAAGSAAMLTLVALPLDALETPLAVAFIAFVVGQGLMLGQPGLDSWWLRALAATAATPLLISPYPLWQLWGWIWLGTATVTLLVLPAVIGGLLSLVGRGPAQPASSFVPVPLRTTALVVCAGLWVGGGWALIEPPRLGSSRLVADLGVTLPARTILHSAFFEPDAMVEIRSHGASKVEALKRAAQDARALAQLVPAEAVRLDSPGTFVATERELALRRRSLAELGVTRKIEQLHDALESQGLRPDAFAESSAGAADIERAPGPEAALHSALGPWIDRYLQPGPEGEGWYVRSFLQLRPGADVGASLGLADAAEPRFVPVGPRVARWEDRQRFASVLLLTVAGGLWLGTFIAWLASGSLRLALAAGVTAGATQSGTLLIVHGVFDQSLGPLCLPALVLTGAAAFITAVASCRAAMWNRPLPVPRLLLATAVSLIAGIGLIVGKDPLWPDFGVVLACGSALAATMGIFVAPGLSAVFGTPRVKGSDPS